MMRFAILIILGVLLFSLAGCATTPPVVPNESSLAHIREKMESGEHFTIVALGDSVTEVNWTTRGHLNWVGLLQAGLFESGHAKRYTVINSGNSGSTVPDGLARLDRDVLRFEPDLVIIGFGINGWMFFQVTPQETRAALEKMIDRIRAESEASILLRTPHPIMNKEMTEWVEPEVYTQTLAVIREVAVEKNIELVDHHKLWTNPNPDPKIMYDYIHPNEEGHLRFYRDITPIFGLKTQLRWMK